MKPRAFRPRLTAMSAALVAVVALVAPPVAAAVDDGDQRAENAKAAQPGAAQAAYALPLPQAALPRDAYNAPHHDYPAVDLPVPLGTEAYAVTSGHAEVFTDDGCGNGVELTGDDGVLYTYCHFDSHAVPTGPVALGQLLGATGSTGNSTGPHLHFQVKTSGVLRCPQPMLLAIYDGQQPPPPTDLPTEGCFSLTASPEKPLGLH